MDGMAWNFQSMMQERGEHRRMIADALEEGNSEGF